MSKKFKNIENDEAFKNFKLEDYMPSMPEHKSEEVYSAVEQEPVEEGDGLFPVLDEPDTSIVLYRNLVYRNRRQVWNQMTR